MAEAASWGPKIDCSPPGDPALWMDPLITSLREVFGVDVVVTPVGNVTLPVVDGARVTGALIGSLVVVLDQGDPEDMYMTVALAEYYLVEGLERRLVEPLAIAP